VFDPQGFQPALNLKGDNVYQFTSITIGLGVTVKLSGKNLHSPIFWLSQGPVRIDGVIDLNGDDSASYASGTPRVATFAGAGGYGGGVGALNGNSAQPGQGPGGGQPNQWGAFVGNKLLVPLSGGSGGGGSAAASGGGGGGALLIASSASITLNGKISADGGNQGDPGFAATGGSGGGIRLVAPVITGSGAALSARGGLGTGGVASGQDGHIRLEAYQNNLRGDVNGTPLSSGLPFKLFLPPDSPPSIRVVAIDGSAFSSNATEPSGLPKTIMSHTKAVVLTLEARRVKPGTVIKVHLYSTDGDDRTVESTPLVGTLELSRATATMAIPRGFSHLAFDANWPLDPPPARAKMSPPLSNLLTKNKGSRR
jgi:hypothetical protein